MLMRKSRAYAEIYNDLWGTVVNVFRVLRDPEQAQELERLLRLTPFAREEFDLCGEIELVKVQDPVELARRTILRSFAGFGSAATNAKHSTGFRSNSTRAYTTPAHDWANLPDLIPAFTNRLKGVVVENRPAADVITHHDGPATLHYVDPPYPHATRSLKRGNSLYVHEMTNDQHRELATVLRNLKGMVVISGYPCELYDDELYPDWTRIERKTFADGARKRIEVLWLSPNCSTNDRLFYDIK